VKVRVDDNLGTNPKMTPPVYQAVIDQAHKHGLRVAAHIYYLDDATGCCVPARTSSPTACGTATWTMS